MTHPIVEMERGRIFEFEMVNSHPEWNDAVIRVADADIAIRFYHEFTGMSAIHDKRDATGKRWVQMRQMEHAGAPNLIIEEDPQKQTDTSRTMFTTIGLRLYNRAEVDRMAEKAKQADCLVTPAHEGGPFRGFMCVVSDPDGNHIDYFCPAADKISVSS